MCVAVYSFDGLVVFGLLVICTCAYVSRVPRLKQWLLSEKKGFFGIFYKGKYGCVEHGVVVFTEHEQLYLFMHTFVNNYLAFTMGVKY